MAGILKVDQVQSDSNLSFQVAGANVAYMNSTGLQMTGGQIIAGSNTLLTASGLIYANAGIKFPATQVSSADANTLDDYEEGTWIPKHSDGTDMTISITCSYIKIGALVWVNYDAQASKSTGGIYGLPFTSATSTFGGNYSGYIGYETLSTSSAVYTHINQNSTNIQLFNGNSSITIGNGERVIGGSFYRTA
jgi:hypothetical protein